MAMTSAAVLYDRITDCGVFVKRSHIGVSQVLCVRRAEPHLWCRIRTTQRRRLRADALHACMHHGIVWIIAVLVRCGRFLKTCGCVAGRLCTVRFFLFCRGGAAGRLCTTVIGLFL